MKQNVKLTLEISNYRQRCVEGACDIVRNIYERGIKINEIVYHKLATGEVDVLKIKDKIVAASCNPDLWFEVYLPDGGRGYFKYELIKDFNLQKDGSVDILVIDDEEA